MSKDFTTYSSIDLAEDQSFIEYVKRANPQSIKFWMQWIEKHPTHLSKVKQAERMINDLLVQEESLSPSKVDELFAKIESSMEQPIVARVRKLSWMKYAAAAAILLLVSVFIFWPSSSTNIYKTKFAQREEIMLPDQSEVLLNADSELEFDDRQWSAQRLISLNGEAFFEVKKGSRFVVNTTIGSVEVLGTSFNVLNRDGYFEVICKTGKVKVSVNQLGETEIIEPNQGIFYSQLENKLVKKIISKEQTDLWTTGEIRFEEKPIQYVLNEISRQFDVQINGANIEAAYTGTVKLSSLDSALYAVCWPMNLKYEINGRQVEIVK